MAGDAMNADSLYSVTCQIDREDCELRKLATDYDGIINYCIMRASHGHDDIIIKEEIPLEVIQRLVFDDDFHIEPWCEGFLRVCWGINRDGVRREEKK